jgi:hypothetical protein
MFIKKLPYALNDSYHNKYLILLTCNGLEGDKINPQGLIFITAMAQPSPEQVPAPLLQR